MAIVNNSLIECSLVQTVFGQQVLNVYQYQVSNFTSGITPIGIAEAYWNDIKTVHRALASVSFGDVFLSVRVRELDSLTGALAEFAIPSAERLGTRAALSPADAMPSFCAGAFRLAVGSRVTRPGQKRYGYLGESDSSNNVLTSAYIALLTNIATHMVGVLTLGAPALLVNLNPKIVRKGITGLPVANQSVTGFVVNNNVTTQNTRKLGRGA